MIKNWGILEWYSKLFLTHYSQKPEKMDSSVSTTFSNFFCCEWFIFKMNNFSETLRLWYFLRKRGTCIKEPVFIVKTFVRLSDVARPQDQGHLFFQDQDRSSQDQDHFFKTKTTFFKDHQIIKPRPQKRSLPEKNVRENFFQGLGGNTWSLQPTLKSSTLGFEV